MHKAIYVYAYAVCIKRILYIYCMYVTLYVYWHVDYVRGLEL